MLRRRSGEECISLVRTKEYACILLDIWLGEGIGGLETLSQLKGRRSRRFRNMISGHGNIETAVRSHQARSF